MPRSEKQSKFQRNLWAKEKVEKSRQTGMSWSSRDFYLSVCCYRYRHRHQSLDTHTTQCTQLNLVIIFYSWRESDFSTTELNREMADPRMDRSRVASRDAVCIVENRNARRPRSTRARLPFFFSFFFLQSAGVRALVRQGRGISRRKVTFYRRSKIDAGPHRPVVVWWRTRVVTLYRTCVSWKRC